MTAKIIHFPTHQPPGVEALIQVLFQPPQQGASPQAPSSDTGQPKSGDAPLESHSYATQIQMPGQSQTVEQAPRYLPKHQSIQNHSCQLLIGFC